MSLYYELKRRNVLRVAAAYLAATWLVTEAAALIFPLIDVPERGLQVVMTACALGFVPALLIAWFFELTPDGIKLEKDIVRERSITYITAKRLDTITISLIVLALTLFAADHLGWKTAPPPSTVTTTHAEPGHGPEPATEHAPAPNSIAVLPFVNMSDDAGNQYFADGISEELLNLLAKVPELRVISRSSAFYYKDKQMRLDEIARELHVANVLEGSVRKSGRQVRITAQLIQAPSDTHLWSRTWDRTLDDIFAIQDEIANAVVDSLRLTILGEAPRAQSVDPEAYALYLQARYLNSQVEPGMLQQAIDLYHEALAIDPEFARAWRGLAVSYTNQANKGLRPQAESYALARDAIDTALAIDPEFAMAYATLAMFAMTRERDLAAAAGHLEAALLLEPTNAVLHSYASSLLLRLGRIAEAVAIREKDVTLDPVDAIGYHNLAWAYYLAGRLDEAAKTIDSLLMLSPRYGGAHEMLGKVLLQQGHNEAALEAMQAETSEVWRLFGLTMACHALDREQESGAALAELIAKYGPDRAYHVAQALSFRGEADRAFEWLEAAAHSRDASLTYIAIEPMFANIHDDPRWKPFLEATGTSREQLAEIRFEPNLPGNPAEQPN